jgi:Tfp pilus assembly protein PilP
MSWLNRTVSARTGLVLLCLFAAGQAPAFAQDDKYTPEPAEAGGGTAPAEGEIDSSLVDDLLQRDEEVLNDPGIYNYDAGNRRDPFKSLIKTQVDRNVPKAEERPEGVAGLLIDELQIQGIFVLDSGPVAQVISSSSETSFLVRQGDQLWDGDVLRISLDEIVFKQTVNDPTALKPFREVVKKLTPDK